MSMALETGLAPIGKTLRMGGKLDTNILRRICIPPSHWYCTLSEIPDSCRHKEPVTKWLANIYENIDKARGLLLSGNYSQGKSGTASICLKVAAGHGIIGYWINATDLSRVIVEHHQFDDELSVLERMESVKILVIDEIQLKDRITFSEQAIEHLIRRRIDSRLCTVITTNHEPKEINRLYPALASALVEAVKPVIVSGHNFRESIAKEWT